MGNVIQPTFGWIPPSQRSRETEASVQQVVGSMPEFLLVKSGVKRQSNRVVLWEYAKKVNGGKHLPTFRQEVGDCVSQGAANAVNYLSCMEIARLGDAEKYRPAFQPYIYGISRVQIGKDRINGDGSIGAWAAEGVKLFGVLFGDEEGVPTYSGEVARSWGRRPGPPPQFVEKAKPHIVKTVSPVRTYDDVKEALLNGYPVTVASNRGFQMKGRVDRGKLWGVPAGTWMHQMAFIGVDDDSARPGSYCLNSWGPNAHGSPPDDAPPGGFWVDADTVTQMVSQGDSFAFSQFEGFPEQDLNFFLI